MAESTQLRRRMFVQAMAAGAATVGMPSWAAGPARLVRLVVPQAPGEAADLIARAIAPAMSRSLGQEVAVENRPDATGTAAATLVAQSAPDALTLLLGPSMTFAAAPHALEKPPFHASDSFTHVVGLAAMPLLIVASAKSGLSSLAELEALARKRALVFGSPGLHSTGHLYGELLRNAMGMELVHAPARGGSLLNELLANAVAVGFDVLPPYVAPFQSGQVVPIAVTSAERSALLPDVPSVADFGARRLTFENLFGISAPARLPQAHLSRVGVACQMALAQAGVQQRIASLGARPQLLASAAFTAQLREQSALLAPLVRGGAARS
jgi:tripartite-type tricarboxylate transporter receptor subunit TctC